MRDGSVPAPGDAEAYVVDTPAHRRHQHSVQKSILYCKW